MLLSNTFLSALAVLATNQVTGAAAHTSRSVANSARSVVNAEGILVATDPCAFLSSVRCSRNTLLISHLDFACNCPNNCSHKQGSGCRYHEGPSGDTKILKGSKYFYVP